MVSCNRVDSGWTPQPGLFQAGASEIDITPHIVLPLSGYSLEGKTSRGVSSRLFARVLFLQGTNGERVALCVTDLHSGTRYLLECIANQTASIGITADHLLLMGTHTHTGPAWIYGNSLFDSFTSNMPGFDQGLADWIANRIAGAIIQAESSKETAVLGFAEENDLWEISRNRSFEAFLNDPTASDWNTAGHPGQGASVGLHPHQKAVDPRLRTVAAYRPGDQSLIGCVAFFGAHFTSEGSAADYYSADCAGYAVRKARWDIEQQTGHAGGMVALAPSAAGDVTTLRYGLDPEVPVPGANTGHGLAKWVGTQLGEKIADCVSSGTADASGVEIHVRYAEPEPSTESGRYPPGGAGDSSMELSKVWAFGAPAYGGSEESRSDLYNNGLVEEGMTWLDIPDLDPEFMPWKPQYPKTRGISVLQPFIAKWLKLKPAPVIPLYQVILGSCAIATVPGEPTTLAAWQIEQRVLTHPQIETAVVVGYTGDYGGYFTTRKQYDMQHYEGASTLYGRNITNYFAAYHEHFANLSGSTPALPAGPVDFDTGPPKNEFKTPTNADAFEPNETISRVGTRVDLTWQMKMNTRVVFAESVVIHVEVQQADTTWAPLQHMGRDFNDFWHVFHIRRTFNLMPPSELWHVWFELPPTIPAGETLRVRISALDNFPEVIVAIPEDLSP